MVGFNLLLFVLLAVSVYSLNDRYRQNREKLVKATSENLIADQYVEALFQVNTEFLKASDENEVIDFVLRLLVDKLGLNNASFVPLDEHGHPQVLISQGDPPFVEADIWLEQLASPRLRQSCGNCEMQNILHLPDSCPLLEIPGDSPLRLICFPVGRKNFDFGVLNLFITREDQLTDRTVLFLRALVELTSLGIEGIRLRRRELSALRQMQILRQKTDLSGLLTNLLSNVHQTMEADYGTLEVPEQTSFQSKISLAVGDIPLNDKPMIDEILQGVIASGEPVFLGDINLEQASTSWTKSIAAVPLLTSTKSVVGVVYVGKGVKHGFHPRQMDLLQTIAGQISLVVQNTTLMAELEYKAMIQERTRLAREIHDGLAQTIGFLKLQTAQMQRMISKGELEQVSKSINVYHDTLSEAYQDARQVIDELRIWPEADGIGGWLKQTCDNFQDISGLTVELDESDVKSKLPPEVHAQLIRIVQEAMSNIRKHAGASKVWVTCYESGSDLFLEVRDNGIGFEYEMFSDHTRHGLRSMRERGDLIGADFQVISTPNSGTAVRIRLPLENLIFGENIQ